MIPSHEILFRDQSKAESKKSIFARGYLRDELRKEISFNVVPNVKTIDKKTTKDAKKNGVRWWYQRAISRRQ